MFDTIEKALLEEYKSQYGTDTDCIIKVDRVTGEFHIYAKRIVILMTKSMNMLMTTDWKLFLQCFYQKPVNMFLKLR